MKIENCTGRVEFFSLPYIFVEQSSFLGINNYFDRGGAVYINKTEFAKLSSIQCDKCSTNSAGGGFFIDSTHLALSKVCFSCCYHGVIGHGYSGAAAEFLQCDTAQSLISVYMCSPFDQTGYCCYRFTDSKATIEDANISQCKNKLSSLSFRNSKDGSILKYTQITHMNEWALQLDIATLIQPSFCNLINNTSSKCIAISATDSGFKSLTISEFIFFGNYQLFSYYADDFKFTLIGCIADQTFGSHYTDNCLTNVQKIDPHSIKTFECGNFLMYCQTYRENNVPLLLGTCLLEKFS